MIPSRSSAFFLLSIPFYLKWEWKVEWSLTDSSPFPGFPFLSPFSSFYCLTKAAEDFAECSFFGQRKWERRSGAGREEVYLSERGWAVLRGGGGGSQERGHKREEGEETVLPFTLAAFGLRMSQGVREVFLRRVGQKQSRTSRRTGTWWMFEPTEPETLKELRLGDKK